MPDQFKHFVKTYKRLLMKLKCEKSALLFIFVHFECLGAHQVAFIGKARGNMIFGIYAAF